MQLAHAQADGDEAETLYYVTVLSNLIRGFDKYARTYDKTKIAQSTFPDRFFLLRRSELSIGVTKASHLVGRTGFIGERLIALQTRALATALHPNLRTGLGRFVERGHILVDDVHFVDANAALESVPLEHACALSYRLVQRDLAPFEALTPRTVSILPVARACQARCPFCFSRASASADTAPNALDWARVSQVLAAARTRGAMRAVITGGGEPSLLSDDDLEKLVRAAATEFPKVVLISNGAKWGSMGDQARSSALERLDASGLSVLALSRHHFDAERNTALMNLDTGSESVARSVTALRSAGRALKLRWICVLQRGGIEDEDSLRRYLDWAVETGVEEICFKELYVSTSVESEYHDRAANTWSQQHQVPLRLVLDFARAAGWSLLHRLPWGAPVFQGEWRGRPVRVAAYTEPSVLWERSNGLCRSWNLMADGRCLASLEDRASEVLRGLRKLPTVP